MRLAKKFMIPGLFHRNEECKLCPIRSSINSDIRPLLDNNCHTGCQVFPYKTRKTIKLSPL